VGELEGKKPLGRPKHKWEYDIKSDLEKIGREGLDWNKPLVSVKCGEFLTWMRNCYQGSAAWSSLGHDTVIETSTPNVAFFLKIPYLRFNVLLTDHRGTILVNHQLDA
jgi:hypothetical protein